MLKKGWKLTGSNKHITVIKGDLEIKVDHRIPTKSGVLYGVQIARDDKFCGVISEYKTNCKSNWMDTDWI
jgi:hypothetical protein